MNLQPTLTFCITLINPEIRVFFQGLFCSKSLEHSDRNWNFTPYVTLENMIHEYYDAKMIGGNILVGGSHLEVWLLCTYSNLHNLLFRI